MALITIHFTSCGQFLNDPRDPSSAVMLSTIYFDLAQDGEPMGNYAANLRLAQGSNWRPEDIEVGGPYPVGEGPHGHPATAHQALSDAAKTYLLAHVLANIQPGTEPDAFRTEWTTSIEADTDTGAAW